MAKWRHRYARINGLHTHYVEQGQGPLVVLAHGFPHTWFSWRHQIPVIAEAGFRVIAPDLRGMGQTDTPRDPAWYRAMDQRKPYESVKNPAPFFFIGSEHDTDLEGFHGYDPLAQIAHQYADVRAIEMVPKAGHMLQMERPREVNSIILKFLADLRPEL
jgi:pimeloyl-ACP methyl ester carboxylesterase